MEDEKRKVLEDILKGFEDYAKLKGYRIAFSADNSIPGKFAFKFTLLNDGIEVSIDKVKKDLQEFMKKVDNGEPLDDIPVLIPPEEHQMIVAKLINRIKMVTFNYEITQNTLQYYKNFLENMTKIGSPKVYFDVSGINTNSPKLLNGGDLTMESYQSNNSSGVIQGKKNNDNVIDVSQSKTKIKIGGSFAEKQAQLDELTALIRSVKELPKSDNAEEAVFNLKCIERELKEEEKPNESKLEKFFSGAGKALKGMEMGKELIGQVTRAFDAFNVPGLIAGINEASKAAE